MSGSFCKKLYVTLFSFFLTQGFCFNASLFSSWWEPAREYQINFKSALFFPFYSCHIWWENFHWTSFIFISGCTVGYGIFQMQVSEYLIHPFSDNYVNSKMYTNQLDSTWPKFFQRIVNVLIISRLGIAYLICSFSIRCSFIRFIFISFLILICPFISLLSFLLFNLSYKVYSQLMHNLTFWSSWPFEKLWKNIRNSVLLQLFLHKTLVCSTLDLKFSSFETFWVK